MTQGTRNSDSEDRRIPPVVVVAFALVVIATFIAGYFMGQTSSDDQKPSATREQLQADRDRLFRERAGLTQLFDDAQVEISELSAKNEQLEGDLGKRDARIKELEATVADSARPIVDSSQTTALRAELSLRQEELAAKTAEIAAKDAEIARLMKVAYPSAADLIYGEWGDVEALKTADWADAGKAAAGMSGKSMKALYDALMEGKGQHEMDRELISDIQSQNMKLLQLVGKFDRKMPTHAPAYNVNASFAHPLLQFNLLSSALTSIGHPLSASQLETFREAGERYDRRWAEQQQLYDENTLKLRKLIDELELKFDASGMIDKTLTQVQYEALFQPGMRHKLFDLYSPAIMLQPHLDIVSGGTPEFTRAQIAKSAAEAWGVAENDLVGDSRALDAFLTKCAPLMKPVKATQAGLSTTLMDALLAGRAQLEWMESAITTLRPGEDAMQKIRAVDKILTPRVTIAE